MEFLKIVRRRSFLSEVVYIALNIALAISVVVVILITSSPAPAFALILLSKWRILAVRPRYWFVNLQANTVDMIVGLSAVVLLNATNQANLDGTQRATFLVLLTLMYIGWLLFLKPRSKRSYVIAQADVALFVGVIALYTVSYVWPVSLVVLAMWLIGYSTSRHILSHYDEPHVFFLSLVWGLVLSEIGWVAYHWTIAYGFLPQIAIIALCVAFLIHKSYDSYFHHQRIRINDIVLPLLLAISIVLVLVLFFNRVNIGSV